MSRLVDVPRLLGALRIQYDEGFDGELVALCPNPRHDDAKPSWSIKVSPGDTEKHGSHHCFSCKWGGGPLDLVMARVELTDHKAARKFVDDRDLYMDTSKLAPALRLVVRLPEQAQQSQLPVGVRLDVALDDWPTVFRRYMQGRGVTAKQVERWRLGYAAYGQLGGRVVIPTCDRLGDVRSLTARLVTGAGPRYKNVVGPLASGAVFGELHWPKSTDRADRLVVVCEGAFNALAVERAAELVGASLCVAALSGSRIEPGQLAQVSTFGTVLLAADLDEAGDALAHSYWQSLVRHRDLRRVDLVDDPDELWAKSPDALADVIRGAIG